MLNRKDSRRRRLILQLKVWGFRVKGLHGVKRMSGLWGFVLRIQGLYAVKGSSTQTNMEAQKRDDMEGMSVYRHVKGIEF